MGEPVIMFGIGAAKAGTSWLHRYLSDHPQCHFRAIKELQYFSTYAWGAETLELQRARIAALKERLVAEANDPDVASRVLARKIKDLMDVEHYETVLKKDREDRDAYRDYLMLGAGDSRLVGDITPAYSLLSEERLESMATLGPDVRFVYLMRDPVARFWSHVRMIARERCQKPGEFAMRVQNVFRRTLDGKEDHIIDRSDYRGALARMTAAIQPGKLCVEIYENLFAGKALERICGFLGLSVVPSRTAVRVNAGLPMNMTEEQGGRAAELLAPQYDAVREYFGKLPSAWKTSNARIA